MKNTPEITLEKVQPFRMCESCYNVLRDGVVVGRLVKPDDSFMTKHKWRAWAGTVYLGEFHCWQDAVTKM